MDHRQGSLSSYFKIVRENRNFRLLWTAQIVSEIGDWLYSIAIYSLLFELTGSARSVATALVLQVLPQFFIGPTAGVVNDRMSRKRVMILADIGRSVVVLGMILVQSRDSIWLLYFLLFIETTMWAFFEPGRSAIIPNITTSEPETLTANTLSSITWSFNLAFGATMGGLVAVWFGRDTVFVINAISFLLSAVLLRRMRIDEPHTSNAPPFRVRDLADFSPILEGVRYVRRDSRLLATLLVKAGLGLMGAHWVILPVFGERVFPVSMDGLGPRRAGMLGMSLLMGARGIGALIGPLVGGYWAGQRQSRMRLGICFGFLSVAAGYVALGVAPTLGWAVATVILAHAGGSLIWVFSTTMLQSQTEDRFRGRVFSADFGFLVITMSFVTYLAGIAIDVGLSVQTLSVVVGMSAFLPAVLWLFALRLWRERAAGTPIS
jgi:predicted MFS family arabinose efflux permease